MSTEPFFPYVKIVKCANKDCHNEWKTVVTEKPKILCCGGYAKVCDSCTANGYTVYDGTGDGLFYLSKDGKNVAVYSYETAYKITQTVEDVHSCIIDALSEGHQPNLDMYSDELLREYIEFEKGWGYIVYEDGKWVDNVWHETINAGMEENESENRLTPLLEVSGGRKDTLYYQFETTHGKYVLYFNVAHVDFDVVLETEGLRS